MVALRKRTPARMTLTEFLSWDPGKYPAAHDN
jgi:hypothetical protein